MKGLSPFTVLHCKWSHTLCVLISYKDICVGFNCRLPPFQCLSNGLSAIIFLWTIKGLLSGNGICLTEAGLRYIFGFLLVLIIFMYSNVLLYLLFFLYLHINSKHTTHLQNDLYKSSKKKQVWTAFNRLLINP